MKAYIFGRSGFLGSNLERAIEFDESSDTFINCAARCHGITENRRNPYEMMASNLKIAVTAFDRAIGMGARVIVNFGSTCGYSPEVTSPFDPKDYFVGRPEETNAGYSEAKRSIYHLGVMAKRQYRITPVYLVMPNLYGPGDHFDGRGHVIAQMIMKIEQAIRGGSGSVTFLGSGVAEREFLYVEDACRLIVRALGEVKAEEPVHLTSGQVVTIQDLAGLLIRIMGFKGEILWDKTYPDGQLKRRLKTGLELPDKTSIEDGLRKTVDWYRQAAALDKNTI